MIPLALMQALKFLIIVNVVIQFEEDKNKARWALKNGLDGSMSMGR